MGCCGSSPAVQPKLCPVCESSYKNPQQLSCKHKLCQQCCHDIAVKDIVTCPTCGRETDLSSLSLNKQNTNQNNNKSPPVITPQTDKTNAAPAKAPLEYKTIAQRDVTVQETCAMTGVVFQLTNIDGDLWCLMKDRLEIRDTRGRLVTRLAAIIKNARGMTKAHNGQILIATESDGLVALDPKTSVLVSIQAGKYKDATAIGDSVWAVGEKQQKKKKIFVAQEFRFNNGAWEKVRDLNIEVPYSGYRLTCEAVKGKLFVCVANERCIYQVDTFTGNIAQEHDLSDKNPSHPYLCASDSDTLVLGGFTDHSLWLLDPENDSQPWLKVPGTGKVKSPHAAAMDHTGRMFVAGSVPEGGVYLFTFVPI